MKFYFRYIAFIDLITPFAHKREKNLFSKNGGSERERDGEWGMHTTQQQQTIQAWFEFIF